MNDGQLGHDARRIFTAAIESVHPERALREAAVKSTLSAYLEQANRVVVLSLGKASAEMLHAVLRDVGNIDQGLLVVPAGYRIQTRPDWLPEEVDLAHGGHPSPTEATLDSGRCAIRLMDDLTGDDLLIVLLSGGGSAMLDVYADGISLADAASVNRQLLASGADISEINCVRKHISEVKGGRLAARAFPARTLVFAISDVPGDEPAVIASGPFAADPTTYADALEAVARLSIQLPPSVQTHLERGARGEAEESIKPGDARLERVEYHIVASNGIALQAAAEEARHLGYFVVYGSALSGEAIDAARTFADELKYAAPRTCLIAGGETTVTLGRNPGLGGRNQEFGLAAAVHLHDAPGDWCILTAGTDGIDGVTDAAGAFIESNNWRTHVGSLDEAEDSLHRHNAYRFLKHRQMLLMTGPTGTNVMDMAIGLRG
jgi:glycerate 2-kinase